MDRWQTMYGAAIDSVFSDVFMNMGSFFCTNCLLFEGNSVDGFTDWVGNTFWGSFCLFFSCVFFLCSPSIDGSSHRACMMTRYYHMGIKFEVTLRMGYR